MDGQRGGKPLSPRTKAGYPTAPRTFFRDCQEWETPHEIGVPATATLLPIVAVNQGKG